MKPGIDYFPLDVVADAKLDLIEAEFGLTGFGVVVHLLQEIYGKEGYYIEWTEEVALLFSRKYGVGGGVVSEIVSASIKRGMFDKGIFEKYRVLTSRGVQKRYFEAVSRRKVLNVDERILLVNVADYCKNADIKRINANISNENADISKQSRVEESKGKKSKEEESRESLTGSAEPVCRTKDVRRVQDEWNALGLQTIRKILPDTDRGSMLRKRIKDYGVDAVVEAVHKVGESSFLTGHNKNGWTATFDWFIRPNNFPKVLDGNYDDSHAGSGEESDNVFYNLVKEAAAHG